MARVKFFKHVPMKNQNKKTLSSGKKAVFYAAAAVLFLLFTEFALRLIDPEIIMVRGDDPEMVYSFYPNRKGISFGPEYSAEVATDSNGLRSCDAAGHAANSAPLLFILGDSFAEGWGVDCEKTFAYLPYLGHYRIINGGVHGGSASYYILRSRFYLKNIRPHIILLQLFDNDLDDLDKFAPFVTTMSSGEVGDASPAWLAFIPPGLISRTIRETSLFRTVKRLYNFSRGQKTPVKYFRPGRLPAGQPISHEEAVKKFGALRPLKDMSTEYSGQFEFYKFRDRSDTDAVWKSRLDRMEIYLNQWARESSKAAPGVRLAIFYIPAKEVFAPGGITGKLIDASGNARRAKRDELLNANILYKIIKEICLKHNITLVDGQEIFWDNPESYYFPGDAHLNPAGHLRAAQALQESLLSQ